MNDGFDNERDAARKYYAFRRSDRTQPGRWADHIDNRRYRDLSLHKFIFTGRFSGEHRKFDRHLRGKIL